LLLPIASLYPRGVTLSDRVSDADDDGLGPTGPEERPDAGFVARQHARSWFHQDGDMGVCVELVVTG